MLFQRKQARAMRAQGQEIYDAILAHARAPWLYGTGRAADTVEGRFAVLTLFVALVTRKLGSGDEADRALSQAVFDAMVSDIDAAVRELGVGDTSMAKTMKRFAQRFYGQAHAYADALASDDPLALRSALGRNVMDADAPSVVVDQAALSALEAHVRESAERLGEQSADALRGGAPPAFADTPQLIAAPTD